MNTVILAGRGKLGQAVEKLLAQGEITCIRWSDPRDCDLITLKPEAAIYCGKGNYFPEVLGFCEQHGLPLINASTDLGDAIPTNPGCIVIDAPNASLEMITFMRAFVPMAKALIKIGMKFSIVESHQASKLSISGTAKVLAKKIGVPEASIFPERRPSMQKILGVLARHLDSHAHHFFDFEGKGTGMQFIVRINGHQAYAESLFELTQFAVANKHVFTEPGVHSGEAIMALKYHL